MLQGRLPVGKAAWGAQQDSLAQQTQGQRQVCGTPGGTWSMLTGRGSGSCFQGNRANACSRTPLELKFPAQPRASTIAGREKQEQNNHNTSPKTKHSKAALLSTQQAVLDPSLNQMQFEERGSE
jgi:hypothetical protein